MMTIEDCREFYAREVKFAASLTTPGLVEAFAKVPREKFLGPGPWQIGSAEGRAKGFPPQAADDPDAVGAAADRWWKMKIADLRLTGLSGGTGDVRGRPGATVVHHGGRSARRVSQRGDFTRPRKGHQ